MSEAFEENRFAKTTPKCKKIHKQLSHTAAMFFLKNI